MSKKKDIDAGAFLVSNGRCHVDPEISERWRRFRKRKGSLQILPGRVIEITAKSQNFVVANLLKVPLYINLETYMFSSADKRGFKTCRLDEAHKFKTVVVQECPDDDKLITAIVGKSDA